METTTEPTEEERAQVAAASAQVAGFCPLRLAPNDRKTRVQRVITLLVAAGKFQAAEELRQLELARFKRVRGEDYDLLAAANGARLEFSERTGQLRIIRGNAQAVIPATASVRAALQSWLDRSRGAGVRVLGSAARPAVLPTAGYCGGKVAEGYSAIV